MCMVQIFEDTLSPSEDYDSISGLGRIVTISKVGNGFEALSIDFQRKVREAMSSIGLDVDFEVTSSIG